MGHGNEGYGIQPPGHGGENGRYRRWEWGYGIGVWELGYGNGGVGMGDKDCRRGGWGAGYRAQDRVQGRDVGCRVWDGRWDGVVG